MTARANANYRHSRVFTAITGIRERIQGNPSSYQYLTALDRFLYDACSHVVLHTNLMDSVVLAIVSWQENQRRRKVSALERDEFVNCALLWLMLPTVEQKATHLKDLKLDRAVLVEACNHLLEATSDYREAGHGLLRSARGETLPMAAQLAYRRQVEQAFGAEGNLNLVLNEISENITAYEDFASAILEKYFRMVGTIAQREYVHVFNAEISLNDLCQQYLLAARRALDRCDPTQGALTTRIQSQLMTTRQRELSALIAQRKSNTSGTLDADLESTIDPLNTPEANMEQDQETENIREIARMADPDGYGRAFLGIQESRNWIIRQFAALEG